MIKLNLQTTQKKLKTKDERIAKLEQSLESSREKQQNLLNVIKQLKTEFAKAAKTLAMGMRERSGTTIHGGGQDPNKDGRRQTLMGGGGVVKKSIQGGNKQ